MLESLGEPIEVLQVEPDEDPRAILTVAPEEVKIEKYLTKEQRAEEEEKRRIQEEKEAKLRGDNLQMRGLKTMMGGTELIMKKEKNKLQEELVREDWMNTKKEEDMTEDEKQRFAEQLQKEKDLIEKQRKQWRINLKRAESDIMDIQAKFEEKLLEIYKFRLFYDARIYEQELYIVRLIIMLHDINETKENKVKFEEELMKVESELEEKRQFVHICLDQMGDYERALKDDGAINRQEGEVRKMSKEETLDDKRTLAFVRAGKNTCRVVVSEQKQKEMKAHIVNTDPCRDIDVGEVDKIIKQMQMEEEYIYERDHVGFGEVLKEQFNKIVNERYLRIRLNKKAAEGQQRLSYLRDFIGHLEAEKKDI